MFSVGECNYGGRVTDDKDRRLLMSLLSVFYSRELIEQNNYHVCEGDLYYVPSHGPYQVHTHYCTYSARVHHYKNKVLLKKIF